MKSAVRSGQHGCADDPGFRTENGKLDLRKGLVIKKNIAGEFPDKGLEKEGPGFADASADDDHFRIYQVDDAGNRLCEVSDKPVIDFNSDRILLAGSIKNSLGIDI